MQQWQLELGGEVIARIDTDSYEFPWTYGNLVNSPQFERFRLYFTDPDDWADDDEALETLCGDVEARGGFVIRELATNTVYRSVTLNQDRDVVWFRFGDPAAT